MRKVAFCFIFLALNPSAYCATGTADFQGQWSTNFYYILPNFSDHRFTVRLNLTQNNYTQEIFVYKNSQLTATQVLQGHFSTKPDPADPHVTDVDVQLEKNTVKLTKGEEAKLFDANQCSTAGEIDVLARGCGLFKDQMGVKKIYTRFFLVDKDNLLIPFPIPLVKSASERPVELMTFPLRKQK